MDEVRKLRLQICQKCQSHSLPIQHSQNQYIQSYNNLNSLLIKIGVKILRNHPPKYLKKIQKIIENKKQYNDTNNNCIVLFPRIGAFQIYYLNILVYSKLQTDNFPDMEYLYHIIVKLRNIYLENAYNLIQFQKFRDLQYDRRKKKQYGPSLYTSLKLSSYGNKVADFGFNLLIKQLNNLQKQGNINKLYPYSIFTSQQKKSKISTIYGSKSYHSIQPQIIQNKHKYSLNNFHHIKKRPYTANNRSFTQRYAKDNNHHYSNFTQRSSSECETKRKRNFLFRLILKQENRSISNQKLKQTIKNQDLIINKSQKKQYSQRYKKNKIKLELQQNSKNKNKKQKKITRNNIYFWHFDQQLKKQKDIQQDIYQQKFININTKQAQKIQLKEQVIQNQNTDKNKYKGNKRCSIINRVKQHYLQNMQLQKNNQKEKASNQLFKNKVENENTKQNQKIQKIKPSSKYSNVRRISLENSKQNMKKKVQKIQSQLRISKINGGSEKQSQQKVSNVNIVLSNQSYDNGSLKSKELHVIFQQKNEPQVKIIQQQSFTTSKDNITFSNANNDSSITIQNTKSIEQQNIEKQNIKELTAEIRISQKKRSISHSRILNDFKKLSTSIQEQIQIGQEKELYVNVCTQSKFQLIDVNESIENSLNQFGREDALQPAQITKQFVQQTNFWRKDQQNKQFLPMKDLKNNKTQFNIKGEQLTHKFAIISLRKIMILSQIRLFPQKLSKIQLSKNHLTFIQHSQNNTNMINNPNKLAHVINYLIQQNPKLITRIFSNPNKINPFGIYGIWLKNIYGIVQHILIDDCFAFYQIINSNHEIRYQSVYSWLVNNNCMWFMILEKAIAKVLGNYQRINQISLMDLMSIILLNPIQPIIERDLHNLCYIISQKLKNKQHLICSFKQKEIINVQNIQAKCDTTIINRIVEFNQNIQQPEQSIIVFKTGQLISSMRFQQFFDNYTEILCMMLNCDYFYNQIILPNGKQQCICRLKVINSENNCFFTITQQSQVLFYSEQLPNVMQQFEKKQHFQVKLDAGQHICIIKNQSKQQIFLFIISQFQVEINQISGQILKGGKQINEENIQQKEMMSKKMKKKNFQMQDKSLHVTDPFSMELIKKKFHNKHKSVTQIIKNVCFKLTEQDKYQNLMSRI